MVTGLPESQALEIFSQINAPGNSWNVKVTGEHRLNICNSGHTQWPLWNTPPRRPKAPNNGVVYLQKPMPATNEM